MSRRRRPRVPGTRRAPTLYALPAISDELDEQTKNALALRNAATVEGRCPACGIEPELIPDRMLAGVWHLVFRHEDGCPVLRDPEAA